VGALVREAMRARWLGEPAIASVAARTAAEQDLAPAS
jgi:hypothetical protein